MKDIVYTLNKEDIVDGTLFIPDGVEVIGEKLMEDNEDLITKVVFNKGLKVVAFDSFINCNKIREVEFSDTISIIGAFAFCGCFNIEKLVIPSSVDTIEESAFDGCSGVKSLKIDSLSVMENETVFDDMPNETVFDDMPNIEELIITNLYDVEEVFGSMCRKLERIVHCGEIKNVRCINDEIYEIFEEVAHFSRISIKAYNAARLITGERCCVAEYENIKCTGGNAEIAAKAVQDEIKKRFIQNV